MMLRIIPGGAASVDFAWGTWAAANNANEYSSRALRSRETIYVNCTFQRNTGFRETGGAGISGLAGRCGSCCGRFPALRSRRGDAGPDPDQSDGRYLLRRQGALLETWRR